MTLQGLLRIVFRRWWAGGLVFSGFLVVGLVVSQRIPLSYQAETILERQHTSLSPSITNKEYDMTRLTSESEKTVTLLKSRYFLNAWGDALDGALIDSDARERRMKTLQKSLSVRPVSFTDLFIVKILGPTPDQAQKRAEALTQVYREWNLAQSDAQSRDAAGLLDRRMALLQKKMASARRELQGIKKERGLDLSGSADAERIKSDLHARERMMDSLLAEKEQVQRRLDGDPISQIQVVTPPLASSHPRMTRVHYRGLALVLSLLLALGAIVLMESVDSSVRRAGDVYSSTSSSFPVMTVNRWADGLSARERDKGEFRSLLNHIRSYLKEKNTVVLQMVSAFSGDGKTTLANHLADILSAAGLSAVVTPVPGEKVSSGAAGSVRSFHSEEGGRPSVRILDMDAHADDILWNQLDLTADITCAVLSAGRTPRALVRALEDRFSKSDRQRLFFILNSYKDPLPPWLRH
ncbi:MAG: hypothetical protein JNK54_03275 [Elusimicrobia bacterium]|jgi:uncharacterized protein involved in exopolysaccharide biosynthesis|nr:hypothetical protein [Elusimicrobiota bacterium]